MERSLGDETRLILYALQSQAELGPCEPRSRWGMSAEDRAKHETWANLGKMEPHEAMRLFVKLLDDERPGWWKRSASASAPVPGSGPGGGGRAGGGGGGRAAGRGGGGGRRRFARSRGFTNRDRGRAARVTPQ